MACKNCKFFKKIRNHSFGDCNNDTMFQYAEDRADLVNIGSDALVILGEGIPIVGIDYGCQHWYGRGNKEDKSLTPTNDFSTNYKSYDPPAKHKRNINVGKYNWYTEEPLEEPNFFDQQPVTAADIFKAAEKEER